MSELTESVTRMMTEIERLPGIGKKSAERIAYHLLKVSKAEALALADAIRQVKENVSYCKTCYNLTEQDYCEICRDTSRDTSLLCVVEQPRDLIAIEQTGKYKGLYHVLLGKLASNEGIQAEDLTIEPLVKRIQNGTFTELIMATPPTVEGDWTALYITRQLAEKPIKISRLARGITTGSDLRFANSEMLGDALSGRQKF
ncbi:MAG: recombination mediator RecR [Planctomycetaceae bacterium]|jgi:recombination protein RecR|nr:recombination mediator RecR [Planctomycetaceae bacterium]